VTYSSEKGEGEKKKKGRKKSVEESDWSKTKKEKKRKEKLQNCSNLTLTHVDRLSPVLGSHSKPSHGTLPSLAKLELS